MTTTTNYGWTKPTVGGDTDSWGTELNTDLDGIDTTVKAVSNVANAALPKAGGTVTGALSLGSTLTVVGNILGGGTILPLSSDNQHALGYDGASNPYWETANGAGIIYQRSTGKYLFQYMGSTIASIDTSGNMILAGTLTQNGTP